jgi:K+-sensing histidine kinase KdpD
MEACVDTYFAQPEKTSDEALATEIEIVSNNPVVSGLLHSISGLIAVLDEHRQIVALNDSFLRMLGIDDPVDALGLRHGEALQCIYKDDEPAGCGTTKFCSSCGAAIAIVSSLEQNKPVEKICALSVNKGKKIKDIALLVKSHPINIDRRKFLLIFLQDITQQQQRAALERTFFHDVNNMLSMLLGASELLLEEEPSELASTIFQASLRLYKEIAIQRCLSQSETCNYQPIWHEITTEEIAAELQAFFANHPVAHKKNIEFRNDRPSILFNTDFSLLSRVLCNMILNALEATEEDGVVKIWIEQKDNQLLFCVWNAQEIPPETALRIFQRNFSTKEQSGRGIGTFSMKLFGEDILGGQVSFVTSKTEGTIFRFYHPV